MGFQNILEFRPDPGSESVVRTKLSESHLTGSAQSLLSDTQPQQQPEEDGDVLVTTAGSPDSAHDTRQAYSPNAIVSRTKIVDKKSGIFLK